MSKTNKQNAALLIAIPAVFIALSGHASAFDFNKSTDKRVYCQIYASQALSDVRTSQSRGCGLTGVTWSTQFEDHFNWCMSQRSMAATTLEATTRGDIAKQCSAAAQSPVPATVVVSQNQAADPFPPVVADEPASTSTNTPAPSAKATNFPPVVDASASTPTSSTTTSPVAGQSQTTTSPAATGATSTSWPTSSHAHDSDRERLIEFAHEHRREIRHVARVLKEKLKDKIIEIKNHHKQANAGTKLKNALKFGLARRFAVR